MKRVFGSALMGVAAILLLIYEWDFGRRAQTVVDHNLYARQDTGEEQVNEVEDGGGIHGSFFPFLFTSIIQCDISLSLCVAYTIYR